MTELAIFDVVVVFLTTLLQGFVIKVLWGWFIVPTLGAPPLSVVEALGFAIMVRCLTSPSGESDSDKDKSTTVKMTNKIISAIAGTLSYLLLGWVVHLFMVGFHPGRRTRSTGLRTRSKGATLSQ